MRLAVRFNTQISLMTQYNHFDIVGILDRLCATTNELWSILSHFVAVIHANDVDFMKTMFGCTSTMCRLVVV